jgi:type I restriction enzyme, R subunit
VHFAVDTEEAHMTTRLAGSATYFLPFNRGMDGGAGIPPDRDGRNYKTAYLWEEVLQRDSLLDLLARFLHVDVQEKVTEEGKKVRKESLQTGFDQPVLHTMYVDKRLAGIQAVQTLSRLNRTHPLKDDTFVLDFVNDPARIQDAFRQYYEGSVMGEQVDPDKLYEIKAELDASGIYLQTEVTEFTRVFFAPKRRQSPGDHKAMNAILDQAVARFARMQNTQEDEAELWRGKLQAFRNLYGFLSQVIPYQDSDLEKLFTYLRHLALKLPKRKNGPGYQFDEEVELDYYRLQKISEGSISLNEGYAKPLDGPREVGSGIVREEHVSLSRLIDIINERFGGELNEADQLFFDQIAEAASQNESLQKAAEVNSLDKFQLVFRQVLESLFIERMELNEELFTDYIGKPDLQELVSKWLGSQVYDRLSPGKPIVKGHEQAG